MRPEKPEFMRTFGLAASLVLFLACSGTAQEPTEPPDDAELQRVETLIKQGQEEASEFRKQGGKESDASHPGRTWAARLWEYREHHPGTPAAARATSEALHFMIHAGQVDGAIARADTLALDDGAWKGLIGVLFEAAEMKKDYGFFLRKANSLLQSWTDKEARAPVHFALANAHWKQGNLEEAEAGFRAVLEEAPEWSRAREAEGNLHELTRLQPGQPAPTFTARARDGREVALADYRSRPVVLIFWATW